MRGTSRGHLFRVSVACVLIGTGACADDGLLEPVGGGPPEGYEVVVSGRVLRWDGTPPGDVSLHAVVHRGTIMSSTGAGPVDESGRFTFVHRREVGPATVTVDLNARPRIGGGYDLGAASMKGLEVRYQPIPAADTTFVEIVLPPGRSESRRPEWVREIDFRALSTPLRAGPSRVYFSAPSGVAALDRNTGEGLWQKGSSGGLAGLDFVVAGDVVAMARRDVLTGVRAGTGEVLWTIPIGLPLHSFAAAETTPIVAADRDILHGYDPESGALVWTRPLGIGGRVNVAIGSGLACAERLVSPPADARIECFDAATGSPRWERFVGSPGGLAIAPGRVVLAGGESGREPGWTGLDSTTGTTVWKSPEMDGLGGPILSDDGVVAVGCASEPGGGCVALRTADGTVLWHVELDGLVDGPAVAGGSVYAVAGERPRPLFVLDLATGAVAERIDPDPLDAGGFCAAPAARDGMVFVFGCSGYVYAFDAS